MNMLRDEFTHKLMIDGGIRSGMRVLDVGCGTGDLSMLASELVGSNGEVVGIDISESALTAAREAIKEKHYTNIKFIQSGISALPADLGVFDAVIGRRVLMYLDDVAGSIQHLLCHLSTNGKMIFQESDSMASAYCAESLPLHTKIQGWIWDTVAQEGGNIHIGSQLYAVMKNANLKVIELRAEAILHTHETGSDLGWVAKMMAPRMFEQGVVTAEALDVATLDDRLKLEMSENNTPFIRDMAFGVCAEKTY